VFLDDIPFLIVLQGNKLLDLKKLEKITGKKVTLARAKDIKKMGFEFGGIPCIGSDLKMIVDQKVLKEEYVFGRSCKTQLCRSLRYLQRGLDRCLLAQGGTS